MEPEPTRTVITSPDVLTWVGSVVPRRTNPSILTDTEPRLLIIDSLNLEQVEPVEPDHEPRTVIIFIVFHDLWNQVEPVEPATRPS